MKPKKSPFFSPFAGCFLLAISSASAQNGTWSGSGGGGATNWTGTAMWSGGIIADGVDNTANFTGINISGARSVGLNGVNRTIGNIVFEDLTNATHDLTIGGVGIALTLDVTSGSPTINVINRTLTITTTVAGNDGLTKIGVGSLILSGSNSYSGGTTLSGGLTTASHNSAFGSGTVSFSGTATGLALSNGINVANNITIGTNTGVAGQGLVRVADGNTATLSGTITINNTPSNGGHFGGTSAAGTGITNITGAINSTVDVSQRSGIVVLSGGGSYTNFNTNQGTTRLGANNGLCTSATVNIGASANANLDLAGFNQTLVGITRVANTVRIGNSSTTADSTLTTTGTSIFSGIIQDVLGSGTKTTALTVNGGSLTLSGVNTYTGATTVSAGTLALSGAGSISNSSNINISTTLSVTGLTGNFTVGSSQTVGGAGTILATGKTVIANGTLTPGNSPGTLTLNDGIMQLGVGGDYNWQIHDATGAAGTGYDTTNLINGATLDLSLLSAGNTYNINLWSLSGLGPDVNGNAINFDNAVNQAWTLFSTSSAITGFSTEKFTINTSAFNGTNGFTNALNGGFFSLGLSEDSTDFVLKYTAVPEPSAIFLSSLSMLAVLRRRRSSC